MRRSAPRRAALRRLVTGTPAGRTAAPADRVTDRNPRRTTDLTCPDARMISQIPPGPKIIHPHRPSGSRRHTSLTWADAGPAATLGN